MRLKRIGVLSAAKISGALYLILGLIFGVPYALIIILISAMGAGDSGSSGMVFGGLLGGIAFAVFVPIFYGVIGFIFGALSAFLYNVLARFIGGIELEFDQGGVSPTERRVV